MNIDTQIITTLIGVTIPALLGMVGKMITDNRKTSNIINEIKSTTENISNKVNEIEKNVDDTKQGHQILQRYRLIKDMNKAVTQGYIESWSEFNEMCKLHESYKILGGNGAVDELFERYKDLPIKELEGD